MRMATRLLLSLLKRMAAIRLCLLLIPLLAFSKQGFADPVIQPCGFDSLEATFQATDGPGNNYTVAMNLRNISPMACTVGTHPGAAGMPIAPDGTRVKICHYCEEGAPKPANDRITLAPGESTYEARSWRTSPSEETPKCYFPVNMAWSQRYILDDWYWFTSASLLRPMCSPLSITDYLPGQFLSETVSNLAPGSRPPFIRWANDGNESYTRDHIPFRVRVEDPGHLLSRDDHSCPRLFVRFREATPPSEQSRVLRVDEVQNVACKIEARNRFVMEFDANYALKRNDGQKDRKNGEFTFDVSSQVDLKGRHLLVGTTPGVHLSMVNGNIIPRSWGPLVEGVGVSLTLDSDTFELNTEIPLHIAIQNFSSSAPLCSGDPYYDPPGVGVELHDASDHPVQPNDSGTFGGGHGYSHYFPVGLVYPIELTLKQMGYRIERPGVYKAVAVWGASKDAGCFGVRVLSSETEAARVTVKSPAVTFRVVDHSSPASPGAAKTAGETAR
jgi:hypothetical protein